MTHKATSVVPRTGPGTCWGRQAVESSKGRRKAATLSLGGTGGGGHQLFDCRAGWGVRLL